MKISILRNAFLTSLVSAAIWFPLQAFAEDSDMLKKALDLVHQVENSTGNPLSDVQKIDLLTQSLTLAKEAPNHRLKGHRVQAIQDIKAALSAIQGGDADHKAIEYIRGADSELTAAVAMASTSETPQAGAILSSSAPNAVAIFNAARNGDLEKVRTLLKEDPTLALSTVSGNMTPLLGAVASNHKEVAELLLANKADVNAMNSVGFTSLHYAAQGGYKDLAELLIANKADVSVRDNSGLTPLHMAALMSKKDIVELLLTNHADVNAKGTDNFLWTGDTPLYIAASTGAADVAKILLAHGADVNAKGKDGLTPLEIAIKNHHDNPQLPVSDVADLLRPPTQPASNTTNALPVGVTTEMEQAFLGKFEAALKEKAPDAYFSLIANDPNIDPKAMEELKGLEVFGAALASSNPNRTYTFVPVTPGQQSKPIEIRGRMYGDNLSAVVALKITFAIPDHPSSKDLAVKESTIPLGIKGHQLMMIGAKEIVGAVPPQYDKSKNFGILPNKRKIETDEEFDNAGTFASLAEFLSGLKQPSVEVMASGESDFEYWAICRAQPNLFIYAEGSRRGKGNFSFKEQLTDSNKVALKGEAARIQLQDPGINGTVFKIPSDYSGSLTLEAQYWDDSGKKTTSVSQTINWNQ